MRKYLIAGLLVWVPLGVTVLVIKLLVDLMDRLQVLLPPGWRPEALFGFSIPGFGVIVALLVVVSTGIVVANFIGRRLVAVWETLLSQIPLVRTIYNGVKQIVEGIATSQGTAFRKVLLIEYPRKGIWCLGFQTSDTLGEISERTGQAMVAVFIPTTPNPTSGFVLLLPREEVMELEMSVDEGIKMIISIGAAVPKWSKDEIPAEVAAKMAPVATQDPNT